MGGDGDQTYHESLASLFSNTRRRPLQNARNSITIRGPTLFRVSVGLSFVYPRVSQTK